MKKKHPTYQELWEYCKKSRYSKDIENHLLECDTCTTILNGIEKIHFIASNSGSSPEEILKVSKNSTFHKIKEKKSKLKNTYYKIAASLLLAIASVFILLRNNHSDNLIDKELAKIYPAPTLMRDQNQSDRQFMIEAYKAEKFEEALTIANKLKKTGETKFYMGLMYMYQSDYQRAIGYLSAREVMQSKYHNAAMYYTALCMLRANQKTEALELLHKIAKDTAHYKHKEALEIILDKEK